ncbi:MAG: hypothetical protein A3G43_13005 [Ignavibacteria bacterium RIFCSPLOWO2_12_FULL_56_21]|nr:MAG: hypothetical protein A3G43_13005 [Ignavibacteria bacterium RIFCSPLOWO2_12_FULL_56_21]
MRLIGFTDGASRGNPGESGIGVILKTLEGATVAQLHGYLGRSTNNRAEYSALLTCLHLAAERGCTQLTVHSDSELMVRQMEGRYKIKDRSLRKLADEVRDLARRSGVTLELKHVLREQNSEADRLANLAIDTRAPLRVPGSLQGWLFPIGGSG